MYYVYIIQCKDGTLYTGITNDLKKRFNAHKIGKGGHYTRAHEVEKIVYREESGNRSDALKRESKVKRLSREEKLNLIQQKNLASQE